MVTIYFEKDDATIDTVLTEISLAQLIRNHPNSFCQPNRDTIVRKFRMVDMVPTSKPSENHALIVRGMPTTINVTRRRVRHIRGHLETLK